MPSKEDRKKVDKAAQGAVAEKIKQTRNVKEDRLKEIMGSFTTPDRKY